MRYKALIIASISFVTLFGCYQNEESKGATTPAEQAATPDANSTATIPTPANEAAAPDFVDKAGASDMFEIVSARVAIERSANPSVEEFAQAMIDAHTKSSNDLKKAIADSGQTLTLPAALPNALQNKLDDLSNADMQDFDRAYMESQIDAHQDALNVMHRYAEDGDIATIRTFAAATAPVVQQHLTMAKDIRGALE